MKGNIMKIIVLDPTGVVARLDREILDRSIIDLDYVFEDMSDYITNDCEVTIYHEEVFNK